MRKNKFTLLLIALLICATGFSQKTEQRFPFSGKPATPAIAGKLQASRQELRKGTLQLAGTPNDKRQQILDRAMNVREVFVKKNQTGVQRTPHAQAAAKQSLDSIVWQQSWKEVFTYNSQGYISQKISYYWDGTDWAMNQKVEYGYGDNEYQTMVVYYYWDDTNWVEDAKLEYAYDDNGNMVLEIYYYWGGAAFTKDSKTEITYNAIGLESMYIYYHWDGTDWVEDAKYKADYTYYGSGYPKEGISFYWDYDTGSWIEDGNKIEFQFDENGNNTYYASYEWGDTDWFKTLTVEYAYGANGNLTSETLSYRWDEDMDWIKWLYGYAYDPEGNMVNETISYWDGGNWIVSSAFEYDYDLSYSRADLIVPVFYFDYEDLFDMISMRTEMRGYSDVLYDGNLELVEVVNFYWSETDTEVGNKKIIRPDASLVVYPNPTTGQLRITNGESGIEKVQIFDLTGRLLKTESVQEGIIDISNFQNGFYFLKVGNETMKVIKQ